MFLRRFDSSTQISKTDWGFIYEVEHGGHRHYEVFKKRLNHRFGTVSYPTDKAFGVWACTCVSLDKAKEILCEIEITTQSIIQDKFSTTSEKILYVPDNRCTD